MRTGALIACLLAAGEALAAPPRCRIALRGNDFDVSCLPAVSAKGTLIARAESEPGRKPNLQVRFYPTDGRAPATTVVLTAEESQALGGVIDSPEALAKIEPRLDLVNAQLAVAGFAPMRRGEASELNTRAMRKLRAKDFAGAAADFRAAIALDPGHVKAHYNLACLASLTKDRETALAELRWLASSGLPEAAQKIAKAARDPDLAYIRSDPEAQKLLAQKTR